MVMNMKKKYFIRGLLLLLAPFLLFACVQDGDDWDNCDARITVRYLNAADDSPLLPERVSVHRMGTVIGRAQVAEAIPGYALDPDLSDVSLTVALEPAENIFTLYYRAQPVRATFRFFKMNSADMQYPDVGGDAAFYYEGTARLAVGAELFPTQEIINEAMSTLDLSNNQFYTTDPSRPVPPNPEFVSADPAQNIYESYYRYIGAKINVIHQDMRNLNILAEDHLTAVAGPYGPYAQLTFPGYNFRGMAPGSKPVQGTIYPGETLDIIFWYELRPN